MNKQQVLKKFDHGKMPEIIKLLEVNDKLSSVLQEQEIDVRVLSVLTEQAQYDAAIQFLALGLPKREGIWWAYLCCEEVEGQNNCLKTQNILHLVDAWVKRPDDALRPTLQNLANELNRDTPSSWLAMAVFWSGGNIVADEEKPEVEPAPWMCGQAVYNAINMAASQSEHSAEMLPWFLKRGLHIAMGGNGKIDGAPEESFQEEDRKEEELKENVSHTEN